MDESFGVADEDIPFEIDCLRNPYNIRVWYRYLEAKRHANASERSVIYERALRELPGSYKLWQLYLGERRALSSGRCVTDKIYQSVNSTYERAFVFLHKMPRLWTDYLEFLLQQRRITLTRRAFDRALRSLPVTQHDRIWELYIKFIRMPTTPTETGLRVYKRYIKYEPEAREDYIGFLFERKRYAEAARALQEALNVPEFTSKKGKSRHELWLQFCDVISKNPDKIKGTGINPEKVIRAGILRYTGETGRLWVSLGNFFIRQAMFDKARDVFEEAMSKVFTLRDFTQIFDSYAQFEESLVSAKVEELEQEEEEEEQAGEEPSFEDKIEKHRAHLDRGDLDLGGFVKDIDMEFHLARLEYLMDRRPLLTSSVLLRQNPNNVHEWHKRFRLLKHDARRLTETFERALKVVEPQRAVGRVFTLYTVYARFHENQQQYDEARSVLERGTAVNYRTVDELASVWCAWGEMELRLGEPQRALAVVRRSVAPVRGAGSAFDASGPVQDRVRRSARLWAFYADLEESFGTTETTKAVYEEILQLRVATPRLVLNYASYLRENKFFEESFRAYERAVALFGYPHVLDIWIEYLTHFVERYKGRKLERARDLFEQALQTAPDSSSLNIFYLYANLEFEHGLVRRGMDVYRRAADSVCEDDRVKAYQLWIGKAGEFFGVGKTREIYERAIDRLAPRAVRQLCLLYSRMEQRLGEIDRARAVLQHGAQLSNPATAAEYWTAWNDFEIEFGNEETFKDMMRIKRSVVVAFSHIQLASETKTTAMSAMQEEEQRKKGSVLGQPPPDAADAGAGGLDEEMALDFDDVHGESAVAPEEADSSAEAVPAASIEVEAMPVPAAVLGALDRIRKSKQDEEEGEKEDG